MYLGLHRGKKSLHSVFRKASWSTAKTSIYALALRSPLPSEQLLKYVKSFFLNLYTLCLFGVIKIRERSFLCLCFKWTCLTCVWISLLSSYFQILKVRRDFLIVPSVIITYTALKLQDYILVLLFNMPARMILKWFYPKANVAKEMHPYIIA